jgi:phosphatidylserine/phosphatidylglycerophosphate/cardiolipin synthase-like enzyme
MPLLLKSHKIGTKIIDHIESSKTECILVSPYIKLWEHIKAELERAVKRGVHVIFYIREQDEFNKYKKEEFDDFCQEMSKLGIEVYCVPFLHAKIYLFDETAIVSSMNLYNFSQANSIEVAFLFKEPGILQEIREFVSEYVISKAKKIEQKKQAFCTQCGKEMTIESGQTSICGACLRKKEQSPTRRTDTRKTKVPKKTKRSNALDGFCIRCGKEIKLNPERPFCSDCYKKWAVHNNFEYSERFCHACGEMKKTSCARPLCTSCYSRLK